MLVEFPSIGSYVVRMRFNRLSVADDLVDFLVDFFQEYPGLNGFSSNIFIFFLQGTRRRIETRHNESAIRESKATKKRPEIALTTQ